MDERGRRRPQVDNQGPEVVGACRQNDRQYRPPLPHSIPLFDVRVEVDAYSKTTTYVPTVEMANVIDTAGDFWRATARQGVMAWLEEHETVSSDDLRRSGLIPEPTNPNAWGALFSAMQKAGELRFVAYRKSRLRSAHARVIATWASP